MCVVSLIPPHFPPQLPQVGRYSRGELYAPHFDAGAPSAAAVGNAPPTHPCSPLATFAPVLPSGPAGPDFLRNGGQRVSTLLVYLNTPGDGTGLTSFPTLQLAFAPRRGTALLFHPAFAR